MTDVDDFLAHFGVKGMKWGVTTKSTSGNKPSSKASTKTPRAPRQPMNPTTKKVLKELSWAATTPSLLIMGLGPPITAAVGLTLTVARAVYDHKIAPARQAAAEAFKEELGDIKMSTIKLPSAKRPTASKG